MNTENIKALIQLNNDFYRDNYQSFSDSRQSPWAGWKRISDELKCSSDPFCVLDIACGNMRFEDFLTEEHPRTTFDFCCIDSCAALVPKTSQAHFVELDVVNHILDGNDFSSYASSCDMAVSFGFLHHIPTFNLRVRFLETLLGACKPNSLVAVTFWRFMTDEKSAADAVKTTSLGAKALGLQLDEGDYLRSWNALPQTYRYCHNFTEAEVDKILDCLKDCARVKDRFYADGRTNALNEYLILERLD